MTRVGHFALAWLANTGCPARSTRASIAMTTTNRPQSSPTVSGDDIQFHRLIAAYALPSAKAELEITGVYRQPDRTISVRAVARPEIDLQKLSHALLRLAEQHADARDKESDLRSAA
jgi:hypothetical protein